jgi:hypothetical protein
VARELLFTQADIACFKSVHSSAHVSGVKESVIIEVFIAETDIASIVPVSSTEQVLNMHEAMSSLHSYILSN